jgi:hypothetical protein
LFENLFQYGAGVRGAQQRGAAATAEGKKMEAVGLLKSLETPRHGKIVMRIGGLGEGMPHIFF